MRRGASFVYSVGKRGMLPASGLENIAAQALNDVLSTLGYADSNVYLNRMAREKDKFAKLFQKAMARFFQ